MKERKVRVSVIMACYNAAVHVHEAVRSILDQSFSDLELIISDDASTDASLEIARQYQTEDDRVRVLALPGNRGPAVARNMAMRAARGEWLAVLDSDDIAAPGRVEEQLSLAARYDDLVLVGSNAVVVDETGRRLKDHHYPADHRALTRRLYRVMAFPPHSSMMYRRAAVVSAGYFNPRYVPSEDCDLWLRLSAIGRIASVQAPLVRIRKHAGNISNREGGRRQARLGRAAVVCHYIRQYGSPDPSIHGDERDWDEFVGWVDARLERAGVYDRHETWQALRQHVVEKAPLSRILPAAATAAFSGHAGALMAERVVGSAVPQRLAREWIEHRLRVVAAPGRTGAPEP